MPVLHCFHLPFSWMDNIFVLKINNIEIALYICQPVDSDCWRIFEPWRNFMILTEFFANLQWDCRVRCESIPQKNEILDKQTHKHFIISSNTSKTLKNYRMSVEKSKIPGLNLKYFLMCAFISNSTLSMPLHNFNENRLEMRTGTINVKFNW